MKARSGSLRLKKISLRIDGLNKSLKPSDTPSWKLIRETEMPVIDSRG